MAEGQDLRTADGVRREYQRRLEERLAAAQRHQARSVRIGNWRLLIALAGAGIAWYDLRLLPLPFAVFAGLMVAHEYSVRRQNTESRGAAFWQDALARLDGQWKGRGESGERFRAPEHPYADDLDVFGEGSLFQLINSARTTAGEQALADWLRAPALPEDVTARHTALEDLRDRLDLREDLATLGENVRSELHANELLRWGIAPALAKLSWYRAAAALVSGSLVVCLSCYMLQLWPATPLLAVLLAQLGFVSLTRRAVGTIAGAVSTPARDLQVLATVLSRLEREQFSAPLLKSIQSRIQARGTVASLQIRKLHRLIEARDQARNQMFALVAAPLLWSTHFAFAIERWRQSCGRQIGVWVAAVGELEALSSLAGHAAEHPADVYPQLVENGPLFEGKGIAHPLLPGTAVRNDVTLSPEGQLLLVSGSNMSGKSTLLRSVGLNAVLAWAGAPVRARELRISRLAVGAGMRVQDSVLDGKSRFYAEITRVRQIVEMANGLPPLLFLLDELLSGTNSHDRRIGAEAIVRTLVRRGAIGLVTTHDLALAHIAEQLAPAAANVHFEDHIEEGRIAFDFRMRPGVVQKSNALELMRSVGLEV